MAASLSDLSEGIDSCRWGQNDLKHCSEVARLLILKWFASSGERHLLRILLNATNWTAILFVKTNAEHIQVALFGVFLKNMKRSSEICNMKRVMMTNRLDRPAMLKLRDL